VRFINWEDARFINRDDLQFREGTRGASHRMTSPRTCVVKPRDIMMPTHGSHGVPFGDDELDVRSAVCDVFCESSRDGSEVCEDGRRFRISGDEEAKTRGRRLGRRSNREYFERLSLPFLAPIPQYAFLAAVCLSVQGPIFPSKPLAQSSPTVAMAERQESRNPPEAAAKRSASQAAAGAQQQRETLVSANTARVAPPVVVQPLVPPVPTRTADAAETAEKQKLATAARAGPPGADLLASLPPEEGGGPIARVRADAAG
jgi:hypothetical protein